MFTDHRLTARRSSGGGLRPTGTPAWTGCWPPRTGEAWLFEKDQPIFFEGDPATTCFRVETGGVRSYTLLADGRRQIVAFHVVDEFFGFECADEHRFSADALQKTSVVGFPRLSIDALAQGGGRVARDVVTSAFVALDRAHRHSIVLGRQAAQEKVASFLLDMSERAQSDSFELPMSRGDIGDYLGLTIESVSRIFAQFARAAVIRISKRHIMLRNRGLLQKLQEGRTGKLSAIV